MHLSVFSIVINLPAYWLSAHAEKGKMKKTADSGKEDKKVEQSKSDADKVVIPLATILTQEMGCVQWKKRTYHLTA